MGWNLREEVKSLPPFDECPTPNHGLVMNIIIWNSKGALKPNFQNHVRKLTQDHDSTICMVMETRLEVIALKKSWIDFRLIKISTLIPVDMLKDCGCFGF